MGRPKKQEGHPIAYVGSETKEGWAPEPTMEKPVVKSPDECQTCHHSDKIHYGSKDRWCNTHECHCQAFKP